MPAPDPNSSERGRVRDLQIFSTIVRRGSLTEAAIELGVTTSALSHRLRKLEEDLGVRLLNRTTRAVTPTEIGAEFARKLDVGFNVIQDAVAVLQEHRTTPAGRLRINVLRDAARLVLAPALRAFVDRYPAIHLDVRVDDRLVDIVGQGFDAGIRYGDRVPLDMVGVALTAPQRWVVVVAPGLVGRVGRPREPRDLLSMPCVEMRIGDGSRFDWELGDGDRMLRLPVRGPVCANETEHSVAAAVAGVGFAYCLERRVAAEVAAGDLEIVLPDWASHGPPFTIYYSSRRQVPAGLRQLIDLVRAEEGLPAMARPGDQG